MFFTHFAQLIVYGNPLKLANSSMAVLELWDFGIPHILLLLTRLSKDLIDKETKNKLNTLQEKNSVILFYKMTRRTFISQRS